MSPVPFPLPALRTVAGSRAALLVLPALLALGGIAAAHGVGGKDAAFLRAVEGSEVVAFLYLGAKHMATGYDHLLFLVAVLFYVDRLRDVVVYVSLFSLGHSITLLLGVLGGLAVDPFAVDALIGLTIVYKALDNLGGVRSLAGGAPDNRLMVFGFGLVHGLGLATRIQSFGLGGADLVTNLIAFNIGVELGQILLLVPVVLVVRALGRAKAARPVGTAANLLLMGFGFLLAEMQLAAYLLARPVA